MSKELLHFIVIGAGKAGTTSLFEYLRPHPELHLPASKEKPFFSNERAYSLGWDAYLAQAFADAPTGRLWGKATPQYMAGSVYPGNPDRAPERPERVVPLRIRRTLPDVKLIALLREPVARALSAHRMVTLNGGEKRSFDQAIADLLASEAITTARRGPRDENSYVVCGEYGRILTPYFEIFSPAQIMVVFSGELESSPTKVVRSIFRFLEVDDAFVPPNLQVRYRQGSTRRRYRSLAPDRIRARMAASTLPRLAWSRLPATHRRRIENRFWDAAYRMDLWNRVPDDSPWRPSESTLTALTEHYADDRLRLQRLIGQEVPW